MKIFIENEKTLIINENAKLVLLNADEFVSTIKRESDFVPVGHIIVSLKYKVVYNNSEYLGESIFNSYKGINNTIDTNSPYKVELVNWKLSDKDNKYLEFNIVKCHNEVIEVTRDNYKNFKWDEKVKYQYRGLILSCDHEHDAGTYMIWLELPKGPVYNTFSKSDNGSLPYNNQFMAGLMFGSEQGPYFLSTIVELMDYVDKYYEFLEPYINK